MDNIEIRAKIHDHFMACLMNEVRSGRKFDSSTFCAGKGKKEDASDFASSSFQFPFFLSFDVVIHVHDVANELLVVDDVGVAVDRVLDHAAGDREIDHVLRREVFDHRVDEAAGERVPAADPV